MRQRRIHWMKKTAVLFIMLLCISSITGCSQPENGPKVIFTTGLAKDEVFRMEDISCTLPELMVYLTTTQNQYENVYGPDIWQVSLDGVTMEENVKETVLARIAQIKTMYLLARNRGMALTEEENELVDKVSEEYFQSLNDTERKEMKVSLDIIKKLYQEYAMADKVYHQIIKDINPEISDDEARTITVQHILIKTQNTDSSGNAVPYSESEKQDAYQKAVQIRAMAVDGEHDFEALASQYSEDTNITYSFGKGEVDKTIEEVSFQLETGAVSEVVENTSGYHIIKCISTFNREETDANKLKIVEQRRKEVFGQEYDEFVNTLNSRLNEKLWKKVVFIHDSQVTTSNFFDLYEKYFKISP